MYFQLLFHCFLIYYQANCLPILGCLRPLSSAYFIFFFAYAYFITQCPSFSVFLLSLFHVLVSFMPMTLGPIHELPLKNRARFSELVNRDSRKSGPIFDLVNPALSASLFFATVTTPAISLSPSPLLLSCLSRVCASPLTSLEQAQPTLIRIVYLVSINLPYYYRTFHDHNGYHHLPSLPFSVSLLPSVVVYLRLKSCAPTTLFYFNNHIVLKQ